MLIVHENKDNESFFSICFEDNFTRCEILDIWKKIAVHLKPCFDENQIREMKSDDNFQAALEKIIEKVGDGNFSFIGLQNT
jgi:hypothetical protein